MSRDKMRRLVTLSLLVMGVLAVTTVLPPFMHSVRHLCPTRPDGVTQAAALPQFARRYGVDCSVCHTAVPQLTEAGYKFRAAGFRMPDEIGQEAKWSNWGDITSVAVKETYKVTGAKTSGSAGNAKVAPTNGFVNGGLDWFVMGAFGKYWAYGNEVDFAATDPNNGSQNVTMSNTYLKGTFPIADEFYGTVRAGLMSAIEGYMASDRNFGSLSPTAWKVTPKQGAFSGRALGANGEGIEGGLTYKDTRVTMQVTNGFNSKAGSSQLGEDNYLKDWNIHVNQFIGEKTQVGAFYSNGKAGYAYGGGTEAAATPNGAAYINNYQRTALYASYKILPEERLTVLGAVQEGTDHYNSSPVTSDVSNTFRSWGWFGQVQSVIYENIAAKLAYSTGRPSTAASSNRSSDWTVGAQDRWGNVLAGVDYQIGRVEALSPIHDVTSNTLQFWTRVLF